MSKHRHLVEKIKCVRICEIYEIIRWNKANHRKAKANDLMKERQVAGTETNAEHFMNQEIRLPRLKTLTFHDKSLATLHFLP